MISLHGKLTPVGQAERRGGFDSPYQASPPMPPDPGPPAEPGHPNPGEQTLELDGITFRKGGKVVLRPGTDRDVSTACSTGARRRSSASTSTTRTAPTSRSRSTTTRPGAVSRDRPLSVLQGGGAGGDRANEPGPQPQILVAGIGNAWMGDDGFGGHVAKALERRRSCRRASPCSTSAPAVSTSPTR